MIAAQKLAYRGTIGLAAAWCCCATLASEPSPPQPVAGETPAFRAPERPPDPALDPWLPPEPDGPLTLADALALALMRNPDLQGFSWEVRASEARQLQAGTLTNPEIEFRYYRLDDQGDPDAEESRRRVILSQVLELGGKRHRRVELARLDRDVARWDYEIQRIEVAIMVASRFVTVLGAQQRAAAWRETVSFSDHMLETVRALVESGSLRRVEVHQAARQLGLARLELQRADAELASARFALAALWGSLAPRFTEVEGDLERVTPVPDLDTVLARAQSNPATARAEAQLGRGHAALALAKSDRVPDVTLGAGVRWDDFEERDYLFDFAIDLPIFDRAQGDIREARYDLARAQAARRSAAAASAATIAELYYAVVESDARRSTLGQEVLPAARAAFEAFRLGFVNETETLNDLLDARRDLASAEGDYAGALVDYHQALAALEGVIGQSLGAE